MGGVIVSYGMTIGPKTSVSMAAVLKNIEFRGTTMGSRREFRDMVAFVAEHKLVPVVSRVEAGPFDALDRWDGLFGDMKAGKQFGKLVYKITDADKAKL